MKPTEKSLKELVEEAKGSGATHAKIIFAKDVVMDRRVRFKCAVPACSSYNRHLMCPPNLIPFDEFKEVIASYRKALIVQIVADYDSSDRSSEMTLCAELEGQVTEPNDLMRKLHMMINRIEASAFKKGYYFAAGLIGGECMMCPECVSPHGGEPCRHPFEARPSMEAMGIDVVRTCEKAGLKVALSSKDPVRWTGLVLLD